MIIIHKLDDFMFEIFPQVAESNFDKEVIRQVLSDFYSDGPHKPKITFKDDYVKIEINIQLIEAQDKSYKQVISLAEKGKFNEAKPLIIKLLEETPSVSEYHRILGQIYSEEGDQNKAIDTLIDALKWDPKNTWALLMMGNVFAKYKDDVDTALKYYNQAAILNPEDNIALNNIGANLMQLGKHKEAKEYFARAIKLDPDYPNTYYALAMIAQMEGDDLSAFNKAIDALKKNKTRNDLYKQSFKLAYDIAKKLITDDVGESLAEQYAAKLEVDCGRQILFEKDDNIQTAAKTEFAENHNREEHIIRYKSNYQAYEHLVMHELVHIDFATQARKAENNELFVTNQSHKNLFRSNLRKDIDRISKTGYDNKTINYYVNALFDGLNAQAYNTPIDVFIEDKLYNDFTALRPWQFLSLLTLIKESIHATTDKNIIKLSPKWVLSASKVYNLVNAMLFVDLYGVDLTTEFNPSFKEKKQADSFWKEFLEYRPDKEPGEEYDLLQHWAEDLDLDKYFDMVFEKDFKEKTMDDVLSEMEQDPFGLDEKDPDKERKMKTFQEKHKDQDLNMAVMMFMVGALRYFNAMPITDIKQIAFQIAMMGTSGITPDKKDYTVPLIPGKTFTGYHLLAYYYVSFALTIPEMLKDLQLPFDKEYEMAKQFNNK